MVDFITGDDFKVERVGEMDFKLTCKQCEKPMVDAKQFAEYLKTAMLDVMKEKGRNLEDSVMMEETKKRMEQLKICLHGGYEGIGYSIDTRNGKMEKVYETDKPDYSIKEEHLPPTEQDELWDMIAKRFAPLFLDMKKRGKTTDQILTDLKFVCFNILGHKIQGFTMEDFDKVMRPMIEAAGKE